MFNQKVIHFLHFLKVKAPFSMFLFTVYDKALFVSIC